MSFLTLVDVLILIGTLILLIYFYFKYSYSYWSRRKIPFLPPKFPLGNIRTIMPKGISMGIESVTFYNKLKKQGHKFGGLYGVTSPMFLVVDPDYIRDVLCVDFQYFSDRGIYYNEIHDPISANLFSQDTEKWKALRVKFTPTFTSGKMKMMFHTVVDCCQNMINFLDSSSEKDLRNVDINETAGCFTTDVIGSCAFGIDCNSFKQPNAEFRVFGKRVFEVDFLLSIGLFLSINLPKLALKLGIKSTRKDVSDFFMRVVRESVKYREQNKISRADFLHLLIELKNKSEEKDQITLNEIAAQSFLFFVAGFETSSTTMTFCLFELAQNEEVQTKLREEVNKVLAGHNNEVTYDSVAEMKYLSQVVDETLRLYPPVPTLNRVCTKDYTLKNTEDLVVEKGTPILISTLGLHRDPELYPDPLKFDPCRFSDENKAKRHPFAYLPFGDGPRNCIGLRFGLMQTKIGLANIIRKYHVSLGAKTETPLILNPDTFLLHTINKVYLKLDKL